MGGGGILEIMRGLGELFLSAMPAERIAYFHVAGHYDEAPDLKVDTHWAHIASQVHWWGHVLILLGFLLQWHGLVEG